MCLEDKDEITRRAGLQVMVCTCSLLGEKTKDHQEDTKFSKASTKVQISPPAPLFHHSSVKEHGNNSVA